RNFGKDTINNYDTSANRKDIIKFTDGITLNELKITRSSDNLIVQIKDSDNKLTVSNYFYNPSYRIDEIQFEDGVVLDNDAVNEIITNPDSYQKYINSLPENIEADNNSADNLQQLEEINNIADNNLSENKDENITTNVAEDLKNTQESSENLFDNIQLLEQGFIELLHSIENGEFNSEISSEISTTNNKEDNLPNLSSVLESDSIVFPADLSKTSNTEIANNDDMEYSLSSNLTTSILNPLDNDNGGVIY
ncbi:MAG: hypothetical protein IK065_00980, partial [Neisseriaceae bacterium]|nr:hypothetical protein [Neisseriaceae bacterium]